MKKQYFLLIGWIVIFGGGFLFFHHLTSLPPPPDPGLPEPRKEIVTKLWKQVLLHAAAPALGNPQNRYTLVEFGDFQCPQCGRIEPAIYQFVKSNPTHVSLYFVQRPLPTLHKWAMNAAESAQIAASQGKFWPMYRILYSNQLDLEPGFLQGYAVQAGLDPDQFTKDLNAHKYLPSVEAQVAFCDTLGVEATPTFLMRDNSTGVITTMVGSTKMMPVVQHPPWANTSPATVAAVPAS